MDGVEATPVPDGPPTPGRTRRRIAPDVWAVSLTSLFSDWSYEMVLPIVPFFLAFVLLASPFVVGLVDGAAQFAQSAVQVAAGSRWASGRDRKVRGSWGYLATTVSHGLLALALVWPEVLALRVSAWIGRGSRQPIKKAIVANATSHEQQGLAFGLEQAMDTAGAILGTGVAVALVLWMGTGAFRTIFAISVIPGAVAVVVFLTLVRDAFAPGRAAPADGAARGWRGFSPTVRWFLLAEAVFGLGYFSILLALLRVGENLVPSMGGSIAGAVVASLLLYLLYNLIFAGLSVPVGGWADRAPGIGLVALSFVLFVAVDGFLAGPPDLLFGLLAFVAAGAQVGVQGVAESAWLARHVPADQVGPAFGWLGLVQGFSVLAGSLMAGAIWTYISAPLAFGVSAICCGAGALLLLPVSRARPRAAPA